MLDATHPTLAAQPSSMNDLHVEGEMATLKFEYHTENGNAMWTLLPANTHLVMPAMGATSSHAQ